MIGHLKHGDYYFDYYYTLEQDNPEDSNVHFVTVDLLIKGTSETNVNGGAIVLKYDESMLKPAYYWNAGSVRKPRYEIEENISNIDDFAEINWDSPSKKTYDKEKGIFRIDGVSAGYLSEGETIATFTFLLQDGVEIEDLTSDVFSLVTGETGATEGLTITYYPDKNTQQQAKGSNYLFFEGFAAGKSEKELTNVNLSGIMRNNKYYVGQDLDFTGLSLNLEYNNDKENIETITVKEAIEKGLAEIDTTKAAETKKAKLTIGEYSFDIDYEIVVSIEVKTEPTDMNYEHGDQLNFSGGKIEIKYSDNSTEIKDIEELIKQNLLVADKAIADVDKPQVTFTYADGTSTVTIEPKVTDPVVSIEITEQPYETTYYHKDLIELDGGKIKAITKSGKEIRDIQMKDNEKVQIYPDEADITECENVWDVDEYMEAGNQTITVTYEGISTTFTVVVNDTIDSIEVKRDPTANNKYGTDANSLDYTGGEITVATGSGHSFDISVNSGMIDTSKYESNKLDTQNLPVTYGGKTTTENEGINITLVNYITGIELVVPDDFTIDYGEELNLNEIKYKYIYANETKSDEKNVTLDMLQGYNNTPDNSNFNNKHECKQTITVQVTEGENGNLDKLPAEDTFELTIKDTIKSIAIAEYPNTVSYDYGDTFNASGGSLKLIYSSGAEGKERIYLTDDNIGITESDGSAVNMSPLGNQFENKRVVKPLKVTYTKDEKEYNTTLTIIIYDKLNSISIGTEPTKEFKHGDTFSVGEGTLNITYCSGNEEEVSLDDGTITETKTQESVNMSPRAEEYKDFKVDKNLTVSYTYRGVTKDINYDITIKDFVKGVTLSTSSIAGSINDSLSNLLDENEVKYILEYEVAGKQEPKNVTEDMIDASEFNNKNKLPQTVIVTVKDEEENSFTYDDAFTAKLQIILSNIISNIEITPPSKNEYCYGSELDLTGGKITINYADGSNIDVDIKDATITEEDGSPFNSKELGKRKLKITYQNQTIEYEIEVKDYVKEIKVEPNSVTGKYGDSLEKLINDNNIHYTVVYASGKRKGPQELTENMVSNYNDSIITAQNLIVAYRDDDDESYTNGQDITTNLNISLTDKVVGIEIKQQPNDLEYGYGDKFNPEGGLIEVTKESGIKEERAFDDPNVHIRKKGGGDLDLSNVEFNDDHKAEIEVELEYEGQKKSFTITVINKITEIEMKKMPKTNYHVGDELQLENDNGEIGTILVTRQNGETEEIDLDNDNIKVTGFVSTEENTALQLTVSYTENGVTLTTNYTVSVIDLVLAVIIEKEPKTEYLYGDSLDVTGGRLKVTRGSGEEVIDMKPSMVTEMDGSAFDGTKLGTRQLKVTYGGKEMYYTITVSDYITGIVLTPPTQLQYEWGENLNLAGGSVQEIMASGASTEKVPLSDSTRVTLNGYDSHQVGTQTITVNYKGYQKTFAVVVTDNIQSITIQTSFKDEYKYGEALDVKGGQILATRSSGETEVINITPSMVKGYNPNQLGQQELTIAYSGVTAKYTVTVVDYMTGIKIVAPNKLTYKLNEPLDLQGGQVIPQMASGTATSPVAMSSADVNVTGFDSSKEGAKVLTVNYKGFKGTFSVTVSDPISGMIIKSLPNKLEYLYGESLNPTGGTIEIIKESGDTETINMTPNMVTGYNPKKLGIQTLTVEYKGLTGQFNVEVKDYITKLQIKAPNKVDYEYGESLDLTGGSISVITASGTVEEKTDLTASMISGYNARQEGKQTVNVNYKGLTGIFTVNVVDKIKAIVINKLPNKINYQYGEDIDPTGGTILVIKSSGFYTIDITKNMISGYDATRPGQQVVTVTYQGVSASYVVTVAPKPEDNNNGNNNNNNNNGNNNNNNGNSNNNNNKNNGNKNNNNKKPQNSYNNNYYNNNNNLNNTPSTDLNEVVTPDYNENLELGVDENLENLEEPETKDEPVQEEPDTKPVSPSEKPTETLGVKDENDNIDGNNDKDKDNDLDKYKYIIGAASLILLLLILCALLKRNVKVFVEEDGEFVLGGKDKLTKKNKKLYIDQYLDKETYDKPVKIVLSDRISEKLDGKEIEIKHRGKIVKQTIKYADKEFEIILE